MATLGKAFRATLRWLWLTAALLIIGTVLLVVLGRQSIASLDNFRTDIKQFIQTQTGLTVALGELKGDWPQLTPVISVDRTEIFANDNTSILVFSDARADLDLFASLVRGTPIWRELAIDNLTLTLVESEQGLWALKGFAGNAESDLSLFIDPLLYSRFIRLQGLSVILQFYSGKSMLLSGRDLSIENDGVFHRAELSVILSEHEIAETSESAMEPLDRFSDESQSPAYLLMEGHGDLGDIESFFAEGYFRFDDFNLSAPLADLLRSLLPSLFANLSDFKANADGELWFDIHPGGSLDFSGNLTIGEVPLNWLADVPSITDIKTDITGWFTPGVDWGTRLQGFSLNWSETKIEPLNLVFTQQLGSHWQDFDVSVNHLDVTLMSELLRATRIADEKVLSAVEKLNPKGDVNALTVGHNETGYYVSANLQKITIASWKGAPGVKDLDGYMELYDTHGLFEIADQDGFSAYFPTVYRDYLAIEEASGTISFAWQREQERLTLRSDIIKAKVDAGRASVLFSLNQDLPSKGNPPEVNLLIGGRDLDAKFRAKYLPYKLAPQLDRWLKEAILQAHVDEFGLLIRNGPPLADPLSQTTQLVIKASGADVDYDPNWMGLRGAEVELLVDDTYTVADLKSGTVGTAQISDGKVIYQPRESDGKPFLSVEASVEAELSEAINILTQSPVRDSIAALRDWQYSGNLHNRLDLLIPMFKSKSQQGHYRVASEIKKGGITIGDGPIALTEIDGKLNFSMKEGLTGQGIRTTLWQRPMLAELYLKGGEQKIALKGDVLPKSLNQLVAFPWEKVVKGAIPVDAVVSIPWSVENKLAVENKLPGQPSEVTLQIASDLQGVALDLPQPLTKLAKSKQPLHLTLHFAPDLSRLEARLSGKSDASLGLSADTNVDLRFNQTALSGGTIYYDRPVVEPEQGIVRVSAYLPTTELALWEPLVGLFARNDGESPTAWQTVFDVRLDELDVATLQLKNIAAIATLSDTAVDVDFQSDLADGRLLVPFDTALNVPQINLSRLSVPSAILEEKIIESTIDPRTFVALDVLIDQLNVGDDNWGSLSFKLRPEASGASFNSIKGNLFGLKPGFFDDQPATEFFWSYDGTSYASRLVGPVGVDDIGDFLVTGLSIPKIMDSESGQLLFNLSWQDQPWNVSRENLSGEFQIQLKKGSFYKSPGGAGAALKMVSLINFANWLRRLQLDFSDVVGQNLAYNSLNGTLSFDKGVASLRDPLRMKMPSGRMSMAGDFDLLNEQIDGRLVATLPVATNLPWVVALLGGLPAAAGVYVTSKLVEKQVDRLSSISYKISGPWDDAAIKVDKIFAADLRDEQGENPVSETEGNAAKENEGEQK
mgnify:FL=1